MSGSLPRVAIVGATGAVGTELIACLQQRRFPLGGLRLFASQRSNGRRVAFAENVFYRFHNERIAEVWSVIDKAAIEAQL